MKYEELIEIWNSSSTELQTKTAINQKLVKEVAFRKIRSGLYEIKWTSYIEIVVGIVWFAFLLRFMIANIEAPRFLLSALFLLCISLYSLILNAYKLKLFFSIDSKFSVLQTQQKIQRLSFLEFIDVSSLYVIIPLFSVPFGVVIAKHFLNVDLFELGIFGKGLLYYTLGSFIVATIIVFILRKFRSNRLKESMEFLQELKEVEQ
ncbi:MAG: hypothetical protein QM802_01700 [Agriterribacter sp.]